MSHRLQCLASPRAVFVLVAAAYWDTWLWLWHHVGTTNGYGLVVAAIALYVVARELWAGRGSAPAWRALAAVGCRGPGLISLSLWALCAVK